MSAAGTRSDGQPAPFAPFVSRGLTRLTTIYATSWQCDPGELEQVARPAGEFLGLGRLADFYDVSQRQLPRVIDRLGLPAESLAFQRWQEKDPVEGIRAWYFSLPSQQLLVALSVDVAIPMVGTIPLLEDLYYGTVTIDDQPLAAWAGSLANQRWHCTGAGSRFEPEVHQLVYTGVTHSEDVPDEDQIQRTIYRADLPCRPQFSSIRYPVELNRRPTTVGALGPYVSVIVGHQDYVENAILLSAVQTVGSSVRLRQIRERAYDCVRTFRASSEGTPPTRQRRLALEDIADSLVDLELELSFSVEATRDLGMLVPSLRVESYHDALCESTDLTHRAQTTGHMLERLRNAIAAELTSVQSTENRADDARRVRTVAAVTFVTTVGGTLSLLFGFFGINATQVNGARSIFDGRYLPIYLLIGGLILSALGIFAVMRAQERRHTHHRRLATPAPQAPVEVSTPALIPRPEATASDGEAGGARGVGGAA